MTPSETRAFFEAKYGRSLTAAEVQVIEGLAPRDCMRLRQMVETEPSLDITVAQLPPLPESATEAQVTDQDLTAMEIHYISAAKSERPDDLESPLKTGKPNWIVQKPGEGCDDLGSPVKHSAFGDATFAQTKGDAPSMVLQGRIQSQQTVAAERLAVTVSSHKTSGGTVRGTEGTADATLQAARERYLRATHAA
eukprot:NODE_5750_length_913_cov_26.000000_g5525_i0.p1 GENE.NODE_5750_length_913_cov_26.000000_g5525_i0~~NODE_5750_length_913_cov_26.000000_g5525_i0.p1  ORF type:complete len:194 (+),score=29.56 NODE_5750_length_913_cov_26.000000_g5525_i0:72-653(+)